MKYIYTLFVLTGTLFACHHPEQNKRLSAVQYVDLTYYGDWTGSFSFKAGSTGAFAFRSRKDSFYTGILPDTVQDSLLSLLTRIKTDTLCCIQEEICDDCAAVHLRFREAGDSFDVIQSPGICNQVQQLLMQIENNRTWRGAGRTDTLIYFETTQKVLPLPTPPMVEPPPAVKRK